MPTDIEVAAALAVLERMDGKKRTGLLARLAERLKPKPEWKPKKSYEGLANPNYGPGHPWEQKYIPGGQWITGPFSDAYIFPGLVVWMGGGLGGPGQKATLVMWDYNGDSYVMKDVPRVREPSLARQIAGADQDEGSDHSPIEEGWDMTHIGDIVAYHPDLGGWSSPIESARI